MSYLITTQQPIKLIITASSKEINVLSIYMINNSQNINELINHNGPLDGKFPFSINHLQFDKNV